MPLDAAVGAQLSYAIDAATRGPWMVSDLPPTEVNGARGGVYLHPAGAPNCCIAVCARRDVAQFIVETLDAAAAVINEHLATWSTGSAGSGGTARELQPISPQTLQVSDEMSPWLIVEQYDPADVSWDPVDNGFRSQVVTGDRSVVADELEHEDARLIVLLRTHGPELLTMYASLLRGEPQHFEATWDLGPRARDRWW